MSSFDEKPRRSIFLSWEFVLLKVFVLALVAIALDKPVGSLTGQIEMEKSGYGLYTHDTADKGIYAVAIGPRKGPSDERGVWIKSDGTFRIDHLPVGEYSLRVRAPGYATEYINDLFVDEGKVNSAHTISMHLIEPSVSIACNRQVFTSKDRPSFWVNATASSEVAVRLYKTSMVNLLQSKKLTKCGYEVSSNFSMYRDSTKEFHNPFEGDKPIATFRRTLKQDYTDSSRADFLLDQPLPAGDYVAVARTRGINGNNTAEDLSWFMVTDLGMIVKKAPESTLVRAIDLNTLKPVPGVTLRLVDVKDNHRSNLKEITGSDGFARIPVTDKELKDISSSSSIIVIGENGPNKAYDGIDYWQNSGNKYQTYFYTDRPVYRLGQTVFYKGIARATTADGLKNPGKNIKLHVSVEDPDNNEVWKGDLTTSDHGTFHGIYSIAQDGKTGGYQVHITYPDGSTDYESFEIAQYRKPEYEVTVTPLESRTVAGGKCKARVKATYYFGAPVANARVKYSVYASDDWGSRYNLMPRPSYYSYFDDWEDDSNGYSSYGGDFILDGNVQTDANGEALVEFDTKKPDPVQAEPYSNNYRDKHYKIEAEVTDISRLSVVSSGGELVTAGNFVLFVNPESSVVTVGQPMPVEVQAIDYSGKPVANQSIKVSIKRWLWDRSTYSYRGAQTEGEQTVITDAQGKAHATFQSQAKWPSDTFYVTADASDAQGNRIFDSSSIWVASADYPYVREGSGADNEPVAIRTDKPVYMPGDTAHVVITAPVSGKEGCEGIVSLEAAKIYDYRVVAMNATAITIDVPIKANYAPNVYLDFTLVTRKHQFYNQEKMIKVSPQKNFLKVAVSSDKPKYKPGDEVKYTIKATHDDGSPAADTELSLAVVDESIYSIRPETAPNMQKFFYSKRSNAVTTSCSFPEQFSGGPDKVEPKVRKDFKDTAFWKPDLITGKDGVVTCTVKLPDNLTTWRATVRGVDLQTDVGEATQKIISTQDLILRLALPRFFSEGDQGLITAIVHNYTDKTQKVALTLAPSPQFQTTIPLAQNISVEPDKAIRFNWPVTITRSGDGLIRAKAVGETAGDAMEQHIPIRALGVPAFSVKSGLLTQDKESVEIPVGMSADVSPGTERCRLTVASSSIGPVLGNFSALIDYPYGCTEQTMSKLVPSIVAMQMHKKLGLPLSKKDTDRFDTVWAQSYEKLTGYHHSDGGWGWWETDNSQPYLTALVVDGLKSVRDLEYWAFDDDLINSGRDYLKKSLVELQKQLSDPKLADTYMVHEYRTDMAKALYTIGLFEKPPLASQKWLCQSYEEMAPEALSYLVMTLKKYKDDTTANTVYQRLLSLANKNGNLMDWDHTPAMCKRLKLKGVSDYTYRFTGVETTALALRAVMAMEPDNTQRIESIKQWLLLQRDNNGWENTKTTSEVFLALMQDELQARNKGATDYKVSLNLLQKLLADLTFNTANQYGPEKTVDVPLGTPKQLTLDKDGTGRMYYTALTTYMRKLKPGDQIADKSMPPGLHISRKFFRLVPTATTSNGTIHFKTVPITDGKIKAGETIMMKVYLDAPVSVPYVMVEAALPSGAEVVQNDSRENSAEGENSDSPFEGDWGEPWWTHQDVLDDRIVYFGTHINAGKSEFHTMLRMELPGTLQLNPVSMEGMYTKSIRAYSPLDSLTVSE
jgi:uncharacterized protein YfaS (alpha-2-macroglobulin family)